MLPFKLLFVIILAALWQFETLAAEDSCHFRVPPGVPCPVEAWRTVKIEHQDRLTRLARLSNGQLGFSFYEQIVSAKEHGLTDFPADIPVLRVVAQQDVFFDSGSDIIRPEAYTLLDVIAESLKSEPPDVALFVSGHTDSDGDVDYNMDLGLRRAHAVASSLVRRGIYQVAVYQLSFGPYMPIVRNDSARNKAKNRRVEFLFGARPEALTKEIEREHKIVCINSEMREACDRIIRIEITMISVPPEYHPKITEINKEAGKIESSIGQTTVKPRQDIETAKAQQDTGHTDPRLDVEISKARQDVEIRRDKIPVTISHEKLYIDLNR